MPLEELASTVEEVGEEIGGSAAGGIEGSIELPDQEIELPSEIGGELSEEDLPQELELLLEQEDLPDELEISSASEDLSTEIELSEIETITGAETDIPEKKGGNYKEVKENSEGDRYEVHHMPADSASPLERGDGPAIQMEKGDHRQTASCGNSREAREYRAHQKELIEQGKFHEALQMDIDDIRDRFGDKYDEAIEEMMEYVNRLEQEGKING